MANGIYLLRLMVKGIKNIEKDVEVHFYKKTITKNFNPEDYKIKAIYGENGSGKTALMSSIKILQGLILDKGYLTDSGKQKELFESINKKTKSGYIESDFIAGPQNDKRILRYHISFQIKKDNYVYITQEWLEQKKGTYSKNPFIRVYETKDGSLVDLFEKEDDVFLKSHTQNLLEQQTFASWLINSSISSKNVNNSREVYLFTIIVCLFGLSLHVSLDDADNHSMFFLKDRIKELNEDNLSELGMSFFNRLNNEILSSSSEEMIPLNYIKKYKQNVERMCQFIRLFKPELKRIDVKTRRNRNFYNCNLIMVYDDYSIDSEFESRGIKKMMNLFSYLDAANRGEIVFIDELDSNINDVYLDKIIEHFMLYGQGQLCFTAHNLSPMSILKKSKNSIVFISSINTVHTWVKYGNQSPENAYKNGFIEDSPFNIDATDFLGILGDTE